MQAAVMFALTLILASSIAASSYHSSTKLRRDGQSNLYPFPRVGRASYRTWQVPINDLQDVPMKRQLYAFPRVGRSDLRSEFDVPMKRQLYAFPRVGRSDLPSELDVPMKRQLYAFPRVGRSDLRSELQLEELLIGRRNPYVKRDMYEPHTDAGTPGMWFGPRLGRGFISEDDDISQNDTAWSESEQPEETQEREKRQIERT